MYIICNAYKNILRNKKRNFLLIIVMYVIIVLSGISIIIYTACYNVMEKQQRNIGSKVNLVTNDATKSTRIDFTILKKLEKSTYVDSWKYQAKVSYVPQSLQAVNDTVGVLDPTDSDRIIPKGYLIGSSQENVSDDFDKGIKRIIAGQLNMASNEVIISKAFSELNTLSIGDVITVTGTSVNEPMPLTLTIIGIYEDISIGSKGSSMALNNADNEIYTSFETLTASSIYQFSGNLQVEYKLHHPDNLSDFQKEAKAKGLPSYFKFDNNEDSYRSMMQPLEHIAGITRIFTMVALIAGALILLVISIFSVRERKYEIGVLRAMGMKKKDVGMGLLSEMLIITVLTLVLGLTSIVLVSKPLGTTLVEDQTVMIEEIESIKSSFSLEPYAVVQIVSVALLLGSFTVISSMLYITRYEPRKILSERD